MWTFTGHEPIIPEVAFLILPAPIKGNRHLARPGFRLWTPRFAGSSQAGFCPCTLPPISDRGEPTFGHPRYLFEGVPPQPNCPPDAVPPFGGKPHSYEWTVLHLRLHGPWRGRFDGSRLLYTPATMRPHQAAVKLYGVFFSHWGSPAFSPGQRFRWVPPRDSGEVVKPFDGPPFKRQGIALLYDGQSYRRRLRGLRPVGTGVHTPALGRPHWPYTSFRTSGQLCFC